MAAHFLTTYEKFFTWHDYSNRRKSSKPKEAIYDEPPESDIWVSAESSNQSAKLQATSSEELEAFVHELYRNRLFSTYEVSYCNALKHLGQGGVSSFENELLEYGKRLYSKKQQKILKPFPTARKLYGYIRPYNVYTGITEYQGEINYRGYQMLAKKAAKH